MSDPLGDLAAFLAEVEPFSALAAEHRDRLAALAEIVRVPAGTAVFEEGAPAEAMYVVVFGQVKVERAGPDGVAVELATIGPRGVFGEMALYQEGDVRSATVRAGPKTATVLAVRRAAFQALLRDHADLALGLLASQCRRLRELNDRYVSVDHEARRHAPTFEARAIAEYPHPIAQVFQDALALVEPRPRLQRFLELFEVVLLYQASIARACYQQAARWTPELEGELLAGARGTTLGCQVRAVRSIATHLVEEGVANGPARALHEWLVARTRGRNVPAHVDRLLEIRNDLKHGAEGTLDAVEIQRLLDDFEPRLREILASIGFVAEYPLVLLTAMNFVDGSFQYAAQRCHGAFRSFPAVALTSSSPFEVERLYLHDSDEDVLIPLFPWMHLARCDTCGDRDVFFTRTITPTRLELIEFERGHTLHLKSLPAAVAAMLEGWRERATR